MKKLLSLLIVLTISGTTVPTTIAASLYEKEKTIKNSDINYQQTNNLEKLSRVKRQVGAQRVYPSNENANRYYDLAINRYGMSSQEAQQWVSDQLGYSSALNPIANTSDTMTDRVDWRNVSIGTGVGAGGGALAGATGGPFGIGFGIAGGALAGGLAPVISDLTSGRSISREREQQSISRTQGQTNPNYNQPHWGHQQQTYPTYGNQYSTYQQQSYGFSGEYYQG
ncbi:MAG: hypothetical protein SPLM_09470 [Spiroplasma phoeniceum]|uniref:hypothetical protein n=1 Tax=Spiroplasma phoeniceum TaxID=47835 RepID=UPI003133EAE0